MHQEDPASGRGRSGRGLGVGVASSGTTLPGWYPCEWYDEPEDLGRPSVQLEWENWRCRRPACSEGVLILHRPTLLLHQ